MNEINNRHLRYRYGIALRKFGVCIDFYRGGVGVSWVTDGGE